MVVSSQTDPVLLAAQRAPLVPLTDEERALLEEVEAGPVRWLTHEEFASKLPASDAAE